jgi:ABC-2 type transport system permease protein
VTLAKLFIFLWKDWMQERSYRLGFILQNVSMLLPLVMLYFTSRLLNSVDVAAIDRYGGNYVTFAFIGLVVTSYSFTGLRTFSASVRRAQVDGTLEVLLLTKVRLPTIIVGWSLFPFLRSTLQMMVFFVGGFLVLGLRLENANILSALLMLVLLVVTMASLGVIAAGATLLFKQGEPLTGLIVAASGILSGTLYPVTVLPGWLQAIGQILPQTHAIEAIRLAMLQRASLADLVPQLIFLLVFAVALGISAMLTFRYATYRARLEGSLAHY